MNRGRGFTLLELLIGMTLLGFMLALLFGGFRLAANSWDAVTARTERTTDEQLGRAFLRRLLTMAAVRRSSQAGGRNGVSDGVAATTLADGVPGLAAVVAAHDTPQRLARRLQ